MPNFLYFYKKCINSLIVQSWHPYPFFRIIIPFTIGILLAIYANLSFVPNKTVLLIITSALLIPIVAGYFITSYMFRWIAGVFMYIFFASAGYSLVIFQTPKLDQNNISNIDLDTNTLIIRITEPITEKANSLKTVGKVEWVLEGLEQKPMSGKVLLYFQTDSLAHHLNYGDYLIVHAQVSEVSSPGNPHQFDYKKYLSNSGIYHQAYLKSGEWMSIGKSKTNPVFQFAYLARDKMLEVLKENGLTGDEYAVISAILLGYDEQLDHELRDKYAGAGALHVLCVSGLHVGIIFMLLSFILKALNRKKSLRILKVFLLLVSIWAYAFITGLSPSVMRASIMFSLFAWRESRKEKSNPYNILAASAFILLSIDPYMITKIGFQLSYAAVLAIISLFNPIYRLVSVKNIVLDYLWKLTVVSFAAQIGTFPFAIFYFHQFPVYFFITNIVVIPLVWLILNTGIAVLVASVISNALSAKLSILLYAMLFGLNGAVDIINDLPFATVRNLVLYLPQVALIYFFIVLSGRAFLQRNTRLLLLAFLVLIIISGSFIFQKIQILKQQKIVVYQINKHSAVDIIFGNNAVCVADSLLPLNSRNIEFNISGNRVWSGVNSVTSVYLQTQLFSERSGLPDHLQIFKPGFLAFANKRLAIIGRDFEKYRPDEPLEVDFVIIRGNPRLEISELHSQIEFKKLIFDASNNYWNIKKWRSYCDSVGIIYHDVKNDGFFEVDL